MNAIEYMQQELQTLKEHSNLRRLPQLTHEGRTVIADGRHMLNLSSNDYLGLAADRQLKEEFLQTLTPDTFLPTSSSSRLLTGNFGIYEELETELATLFGTETALVLNSGYHANMGILPAVSDAQTLILADKLVHASIIDGIRLSTARCIRFRHNDLVQLERLLEQHHATFRQLIIVTESIFSMDGDQADLTALVRLKKRYSNVLLYVDEAHAFGVRGLRGLGCAEETGCIRDIDFLVGTFGKAAASAGAYIACCRTIREYLVNRMRTFRQLIIVTESIFSMDGDQADLTALVRLKKRYSNVLLYVDEAHAFGVRGLRGLGCAEETGCIRDIDFLVGTFGKAAASAGAYIACCRTIREYLVNRMRTLIFTTALPPTSIAWTLFIVRKLAGMQDRREHLARISRTLREALQAKGYGCPSASHIVPLIIGPSADTVLCAELLQRHGFYALPVRPPTVPERTSRIRFSLTADIREDEIGELIPLIPLKEERNTNAIRF